MYINGKSTSFSISVTKEYVRDISNNLPATVRVVGRNFSFTGLKLNRFIQEIIKQKLKPVTFLFVMGHTDPENGRFYSLLEVTI